MKHLFFKRVPDLHFVERLLKAYGIENINTTTIFTKDDLRMRNTHEAVKEFIDDLKHYYIPCKYKVYVECLLDNNISIESRIKKSITLLRQILRLHSCYILSNQVMKFGEKKVHYTIMWPEKPSHMIKQENDVTISFN
jgi:hypothetical protein